MSPDAAYQQAAQALSPFRMIPHIELSAIDMALDMTGRYATYGLPFDFVRD